MIARIPPFQLALFVLCAVLSLVLAYEVAVPASPFDVPAQTYAFRTPAALIPAVPAPPSSPSFADIDARPLFAPDRKPVAASNDKQAAGAPEPLPADLALVGVIIEGDNRMALVRSGGAAFASSMTVGSAIGSWKLAEIDPDKVVFQSGSSSQSILLASNRGQQNAGNPAPEGAAGPNAPVPAAPISAATPPSSQNQ